MRWFRDTRGFTLVELLLASAIAAGLLVGLTRIGTRLSDARAQRETRERLELLRYALLDYYRAAITQRQQGTNASLLPPPPNSSDYTELPAALRPYLVGLDFCKVDSQGKLRCYDGWNRAVEYRASGTTLNPYCPLTARRGGNWANTAVAVFVSRGRNGVMNTSSWNIQDPAWEPSSDDLAVKVTTFSIDEELDTRNKERLASIRAALETYYLRQVISYISQGALSTQVLSRNFFYEIGNTRYPTAAQVSAATGLNQQIIARDEWGNPITIDTQVRTSAPFVCRISTPCGDTVDAMGIL